MKNNMSTWSKWQIAVGGWCLGIGMMGCTYEVDALSLWNIGIGVINLTMGWLRDEE